MHTQDAADWWERYMTGEERDGVVTEKTNDHISRPGKMVGLNTSEPSVHQEGWKPRSETFLEIAAEATDPTEWAYMMMAKGGQGLMTPGEARERVKTIIREAIEMEINNRARTKGK